MNARKTQWTGIGLLLALGAGSPAIADDTEFMLLTPATAEQNKPNILFILDTSGSMTTLVATQEPYDSTRIYPTEPAGCDPGSVYWTDVDVTPDCLTSENAIQETAFLCASAAGQLRGIGSFSGTMVQRRNDNLAATSRWEELEPNNPTAVVECQADSGVHGTGTTDELWASNDPDPDDNGFTLDPAREIAWGSAPASVTYTVFDGNYLNWKASAQSVNLSRMAILKAVTKAVLESISDVNVGIMRFHTFEGGPVIKAMSDLDANRTAILQTIDTLNPDGFTPLSETLFESALYWRGLNAHYGNATTIPTDPDALETTSPNNYLAPETNVCSKNFNVLVTDGEPTEDVGTATLLAQLPGFGTTCDRMSDSNGDGVINGDDQGQCLDDVGKYLATVDIDPNTPDDQFVTTHTIGFDIDVALLAETAADSGGTYFLADDVETLALALLNIIADITERSMAFSAPAVSVNTFNRTQNLNDLYLTVFSPRTNVHWPGNLKKFTISGGQILDANDQPAVDPATGFFKDSAISLWTDGAADGNEIALGGAAHELPLPSARKLYTNNGTAPTNLALATNAISVANADAFVPLDFGLTGADGEPTEAQLIDWMRGVDVRDEDLDDDNTDVRDVMGDPLHSQPAAVVYGGTEDAPDVVVFTATNDGYLHAVDGDTGEELWAFVPKELLGDMNRLFFDPKSNFKHYGIDGDIVPVVFDADRDGTIETGDFVRLVFGLRRGGSSYYALDVTDRNAPTLLWIAREAEFGQTWSRPVIARVDIDHAELNANQAVVIVGGGYDTVHDTAAHPSSPDALGAGIYMLDLETGKRLWSAGPGNSITADLKLGNMTRAIPTEVRVIDVNGDGQADRMYASDLGGQIWRFDITNGALPADLVVGGVIARLGAEGSASVTAQNTRRFYTSPDVAIFTDPLQNRRFISISIGSGYRAHPLDDTAADRFFSIRDGDVFNSLTTDDYLNYDVVTDADLVEVSGQVRVVVDSDDRGWKFTLPDSQKVITDSFTFDDSVFFVGFSPETNLTNPCQPGNGRNFLYQVSIVNGDPVVNNLDTLAPELADAERVTELAQGGIAPSPTFLFPGSTDPDCEGAACQAPPLACVGVECFTPDYDPRPIRTLWTQDGIE